MIWATAFPYGPGFADTITRGDYINLTAVFDLTYPRLKKTLLLGTRWGDENAKLIPAPGDPYYLNYSYNPMSFPIAPPPDEAVPPPPPSAGRCAAADLRAGAAGRSAAHGTADAPDAGRSGFADLRWTVRSRSAATARGADACACRRTSGTGRWWLMMTRFVRNQLIIFTIASIVGVSVMLFTYMQVPTLLGLGRINVKLELPAAGGLYKFSNVTYRGVEVGKVTDVKLTETGAEATLTLDTSPKIPADLQAEVRSVSAVGEQYVDLRPRTDSGPYLKDGSVIEKDEHDDPAGSRPDARPGEQAGEQHSGGPDLGSAGRVVQGVQRRGPGFPVAAGLRFQGDQRRQQRLGSGEGPDR